MPTGSVSAGGPWYPSWLRRTLCPTGKNYVTRRLVQELPWVVARVVRNLDRMEMEAPEVTEGDVLITIERTHPNSTNAKNLWVKLEVGGRLSSKRAALREAIRHRVSEVLADVCSSRTGRPTVDIDIVFVDRTGTTIGTNGERLGTTGSPPKRCRNGPR